MHVKVRIDARTGHTRILGPVPPGEHTAEIVIDQPKGYKGRALWPAGNSRREDFEKPETALEWAAHMIRAGANQVIVHGPERMLLEWAP